MYLSLVILGVGILNPVHVNAQAETIELDSMYHGVKAVVYIDSITISASRKGFDIEDFIRFVREDKSFHQAFKNIRILDHQLESDIIFYNKKGKTKATYQSKAIQEVEDSCRTMKFLHENVDGNYYKRKKKRYYTSRLYEHLFFTKDTICYTGKDDPTDDDQPKSQLQIQIEELKKLIFSPGEEANVPVIGKKTEVFSEKMIDFYDLSISSELFQDSIESYVFTIDAKAKHAESRKKMIVRHLKTYFSKDDLQVLGRDFRIKYKTLLYNFDIDISIRLKKMGELYVPDYLIYDGHWDLLAKKPEICKFKASFKNYGLPVSQNKTGHSK